MASPSKIRKAALVVFSVLGVVTTLVLRAMSGVGEALDTGSHTRQGLYLTYKLLSLIPLLIVLLVWGAIFIRRRLPPDPRVKR
jgi:hypothetical protein